MRRTSSSVIGLAYLLACCFSWSAHAQQRLILVGSGSTVPGPLYSLWADAYNVHSPSVQVRYLAMGTSEGLKQLEQGATDFGAGEVLPSSTEMQTKNLVLLPTVLVGIVPIYNIPGVSQRLRFSGDVLADIYLGEITRWNHPRIARLNPGTAMPDVPIRVICRPAGKGSNFIFSDYLSKASASFHSRLGRSASPKWPVGEPANRSSDMAEKVRTTAGAIGFIELNYAVKQHIAYASVRNSTGEFVAASAESLRFACQAVWRAGAHEMAISLTDAPGQESYPITSFTWIYLRPHDPDRTRSAALRELLKWAFNDGQELAVREGYAALPLDVLSEVRAKLGSMASRN